MNVIKLESSESLSCEHANVDMNTFTELWQSTVAVLVLVASKPVLNRTKLGPFHWRTRSCRQVP